MTRVFSGIKPTGHLTLGNYLGAMRRWATVDQYRADALFCIVDLHAMTIPYDPADLRARNLELASVLLAAGIDPARSILFIQSDVREHTELAWILTCLTGMGEASRMTQFKDKSAKQEFVGVGLFTYPILQAADILLYQADQVPVGADQKQHLELTRDLALRFNHRLGETFRLPQPYILKEVEKITDLQQPTAKMSKSSSSPQGILDLLDEPGPLRKKIMRAVTDTGTEIRADEENKPGITNLLRILSALTKTPIPELEKRYEGQGYGEWDNLRTAHHHPTRLSDVLEEEDERSSRRTAGE